MRLNIRHLSIPTGDGDAPPAFFRDPLFPASAKRSRASVSRNRQEPSAAPV